MSYANTAKPSTPQPYPARQDITRQITEKAQPLQNFSSASMRNGSNLAQATVEGPAADSPVEPAVKKPPTVQATVIPPRPKEEKKGTTTLSADQNDNYAAATCHFEGGKNETVTDRQSTARSFAKSSASGTTSVEHDKNRRARLPACLSSDCTTITSRRKEI